MAMIICAIVLPIPNRALVLQENGKHFWVRYRDMGEYIEYHPEVVPDLVVDLVEHRTGTAPRVGCDTYRVRPHAGVPQLR